MRKIMKKIAGWFPVESEEGVAAIEYAVMAALVAIAIIAAATTLGTNLSTTFTNIAKAIPPG
jgi:pilus assembly protein Flp/PilA